jgi:hypothetical protein
MRPISRFCFMVFSALFISLVCSTHEVKAQAVGPHDVLISEFRLSGPGGASDEFVEFYCNRDTDCDISNFIIQAHDPEFGDFTISFEDNVIIPARQYLEIADESEYSLFFYAVPDFDLDFGFDFFIDNEGLQLISDDETTVIDSVGFIGGGNAATYIEGTGLERATAARPADQYAYVRKRTLATNGLPQDTDNNANDFVLVSVTGTAHTGITAPPVLGAPGPQSLTSPPTFDNGQMSESLVEPIVSKDDTPNRVRTGTGNSGTLSIRRSITNNTSQSFDYIAFRVIEIPTLNSPVTIPGGQAQLRLITSDDAESFTNSQGRSVVIRGTILEFDPNSDEVEPQQPNGGGLNSTVHANLPKGFFIDPGETVDVQFLLNVVQAGNYRFFLYVEAFPITIESKAPSALRRRSRTSNGAPRPNATRHLVNLQRPRLTPIGTRPTKGLPVAAPTRTGATPLRTSATPPRSTIFLAPVRIILKPTPVRTTAVKKKSKRAKKARIVATQKK